MKFAYDPSLLGKIFFPQTFWKCSCGKVLLTFDDGPNPASTPLILDMLGRFDIKALFFCVGENIERYPELFARILKEGHSVGNHSFNHKVLWGLSDEEILWQITRTEEAARRAGNAPLHFFRPPKGRLNFRLERILESKGIKNVMWSLLSYDYKNDLNIVKFALRKYLKKDSIIVFHDSNKSKNIIRHAVEFAVHTVQRKGFEFGEPGKCLK